jgi:ATP-dependent Clp protease adaptor protein ClpS
MSLSETDYTAVIHFPIAPTVSGSQGTSRETEHKESSETEELLDEVAKLIIYNDDHNTFDWVIRCLIKYCGHEPIQAEQCAWIIHNTGKCQVKSGDYDKLKPIKDALCEAGLSAVIE